MPSPASATREGNRLATLLGKVGWAVNGVLHILIGVLAVQVAWSGGGSADQGGALSAVGEQPFGAALLWVFVVGFAGLALVYLLSAFGYRGDNANIERAKAAGKTVYYLALTVFVFQFAAGGGGGGGGSDATATVLGWPGGQFLVGAVGLVIIGIGGYHGYKGVTKKFLEDLRGGAGTGVIRLGQVGYLAKGVVLVVLGLLVVVAAIQFDPAQANGLDSALKTVKDQPFGPFLLTAVALGFIAFGCYLFVRARRGKVV